MKNPYNSIEHVNNCREVKALRRWAKNKYIIKLIEVIYDDDTNRWSLVFELMDMNWYEAIKERKTYLKENVIKYYAYQLINAWDHMHKTGIFHRDIKPENIWVKDNYWALADLGSCKGIYSKPPFTEYVSTRWYRAPECIMTNGFYNYKMDMWGVGCVLFEITTWFPLFPGDNEIDQMAKIQNILGSPPQEVINQYKQCSTHIDSMSLTSNKKGSGFSKYLTHCSADFIDLIGKLLNYNPEERLSSKLALQHSFFKDIDEVIALHQKSKYENMTTTINVNNQTLMKSFNNDSLSIIKSSDESQSNINVWKKKGNWDPKKNYKSSVKKSMNNINTNEQHSGSDSVEEENSVEQQNQQLKSFRIKLPKLGKNKCQNSNRYNENNRNNSIDHSGANSNNNNNCTQFLKGVSMSKKMNMLKQKYVSPYSRKIVYNPTKYQV